MAPPAIFNGALATLIKVVSGCAEVTWVFVIDVSDDGIAMRCSVVFRHRKSRSGELRRDGDTDGGLYLCSSPAPARSLLETLSSGVVGCEQMEGDVNRNSNTDQRFEGWIKESKATLLMPKVGRRASN